MRKSTFFISALLTTFMLAVLVGVVSAYKNMLSIPGASGQQDSTAIVADFSAPTAESFLTPEQAAALAAQVIGRTDLYSVETTLFNNDNAYLVTFSSGDLVYVSLNGKILSIAKLTITAASAPPPPAPASSNNKPYKRSGNIGGGGDGGGDGEGDDD